MLMLHNIACRQIRNIASRDQKKGRRVAAGVLLSSGFFEWTSDFPHQERWTSNISPICKVGYHWDGAQARVIHCQCYRRYINFTAYLVVKKVCHQSPIKEMAAIDLSLKRTVLAKRIWLQWRVNILNIIWRSRADFFFIDQWFLDKPEFNLSALSTPKHPAWSITALCRKKNSWPTCFGSLT